jgi:cytochrome c
MTNIKTVARLCAIASLALAFGSAQASEQLSSKGGCVACHAKDKKLIGPSWKDVAARYKGQAGAADLLAKRVREGSKGVWGAVPMAATPPDRLSDAEVKAVVAWVLKT